MTAARGPVRPLVDFRIRSEDFGLSAGHPFQFLGVKEKHTETTRFNSEILFFQYPVGNTFMGSLVMRMCGSCNWSEEGADVFLGAKCRVKRAEGGYREQAAVVLVLRVSCGVFGAWALGLGIKASDLGPRFSGRGAEGTCRSGLF